MFVSNRLQAATQAATCPRFGWVVRSVILAIGSFQQLTGSSEVKLDDLSRKLNRVFLAVYNIESSLAHAEGGTPKAHGDPATYKTSTSLTLSSSTLEKSMDRTSGSDLESDVSLTPKPPSLLILPKKLWPVPTLWTFRLRSSPA